MIEACAKTLLVGVGSGNDTAGALIALDLLPELPVPADVLGFLPPWAWHRFESGLETCLQPARGGMARFRLAEPDLRLPGFYEPHVAAVGRESGYPVCDCLVMSLQFGFAALLRAFQALLEEKRYEQVIGVDFGGDVLASNGDAPALKTPIVDFAALALLREVAGARLLVVSPGVDGEIPAARFRALVEELDAGAVTRRIEDSVGPESRFFQVQRRLREISGGHSQTIASLARALRGELPADRVLSYRTIFRTPEGEYAAELPCRLPDETNTLCLQFDAARLAARVDRPRFEAESLFETNLALKRWGAGGTELDGAFVSLDPCHPLGAPYLWMLTPGAVFSGENRRRIIRSGIDAVRDGQVRAALVEERDLAECDLAGTSDRAIGPGFAMLQGSGDVVGIVPAEIGKEL
jgi:hypothetical protein